VIAIDGKMNGSEKEQPRNLMFMVPHRLRDHIQKEWQVGFEEPRFKSSFWNRFFIFLGASEHLIVRLDRMGSEIWGSIDGERNVRRVLSLLQLKHPDQEDLRDRLVDYLKRLEHHGYIEIREDPAEARKSPVPVDDPFHGTRTIYALPQETNPPPRLGIDVSIGDR
jgi:hypothetical protein